MQLSPNIYYMRTEENQLDATEWFIALVICPTCFKQLYAHHQDLETILVLLPHMVCNALVAGGRLLGAERQAMRPAWGRLWDSYFAEHVRQFELTRQSRGESQRSDSAVGMLRR